VKRESLRGRLNNIVAVSHSAEFYEYK
jgi:hypothetical protein